MKTLLLKFGYIGWLYSGFQRGNGNSSVEDCVLDALKRNCISENIYSAARTDRGVSAIGNVLRIDTSEKPEKVIGILNHEIAGMLFHSWCYAEDEMNPRHCESKTYRYILRNDLIMGHEEAFRQTMLRFVGTHDFSNFCRRDVRNPVRTVNSISFLNDSYATYIDINAKSFLWNQIRTMVAYAVSASTKMELGDPFSLTSRFPGIADARPLVLLDIFYAGLQFRRYVSRSKIDAFTRMIDESSTETQVLEQFNRILKQIP